MPNDVEEKSPPRTATVADLLGKQRNRITVVVEVADGEKVSIDLEAMSRKDFETLLSNHTPEPTEDNPHPDEDTETFGPALIAACAVEPHITLDDAKTIWDEWAKPDAFGLYSAALRLHLKSSIEYLGND